jgi:membrane-associated phospholipid phosphatase
MSSVEPPHVPAIPAPRTFLVLAFAGAILFGLWTFFVKPWDAVPAFDRVSAEHWRGWNQDHPTVWHFMVFFTDLGGVASMTMLAIMGSIWQSAIKHPRLARAWLAIVIAGALINQGVKGVVDRPRPPPDLRDRAVLQEDLSYPSGHSMGAVVGFGMLGYALVLPQRRRPRRIVAVTFMVFLILAVGLSRIYLRAHWFSDVIGGYALGCAWLFLCLGWLERRRLRLTDQLHAAT